MSIDIICLSSLENVPSVRVDIDALGNLIYAYQASREELVKLISDHPGCAILCNPNIMTYRLDDQILSPNIKIISTISTGTDHIDFNKCNQFGIKVFSLINMEYLWKISSTAEMAFALMMALVRNIPSSFDSVKEGVWLQIPFMGRQLDHLTVGIVGYGRLGRKMAKYCDAFNMAVIICDPYESCTYPKMSLNELSKTCDVISVHVPLNDETRHMIDANFFHGKVKYLINTSRGAIINENDVILALEEGLLAGYATDVLEDELGNIQNSNLIKRTKDLNIIITPHVAGTTLEAHELAYKQAVENISCYIKDIN